MQNNEDILSLLNESQREAVVYNDGPSLVIAGAGAGKTRVLTYKIAYLLSQGVKPWRILALTFTNKAAKEMKERIGNMIDHDAASKLWMGTFHSIFCRILRTEADIIGYNHDFTIYDQMDSYSLIRSIIREMQLDDKVYKYSTVSAHISNAKNALITAENYGSNRQMYEADQAAKIPATIDIYKRYSERCRQANAMDFDDLLLLTYLLFQRRPDICKRYSEYFQYVLVDEYQDTNFAQHSIVYQLTHESQRVCVVGDDAQSIYSFRGANIDNILRFKELYNGCKIFKLEQNYRSTQTIVGAANSLIAHNERQIHKEVFSKNDKGALLEVTVAYSDAEEGAIVANKIMKMSRSGKDGYADFAILYRINAQSRVLEEALRSKSIPYRIYGGLSFYQRKEIKDIVAYFRLSVNSDDEEAFKRIVNYPARGIGQTTVGRILQAATEKQTSVWNIVSEPVKYNLNVNKSTLQKISEFHELMEGFKSQSSTCDAYTLAMQIIKESGIMADIYSDTSAEKVASQENVQELLNAINDFVAGRREEGSTEYVSISDYLQEISLISDLDQEKDDDDRKVTLMTVHSAKGLEFKNVFIVGLEENLFPSIQSVDSPRALEEERRLLYVAITRAKSMCFLSYAKSRYLYGHLTFCNPSRFLHDIEPCYLDISNETSDVPLSHKSTNKRMPNLFQSTRRERPTTQYTSDKPAFSPTYQSGFTKPLRRIETHTNQKEISDTSSSPYPGLTVGQTIEHSRFGLGKIVRIEGSGDSAKATVEFRNAGTKQLLLKFARFNVIG